MKGNGAQFVRYFGPLLDALRALGGSATPGEAADKVAEICSLGEKKQNEVTESGQPRFRNQVAWARFYLSRAGLLGSSARGVWSLTEEGMKAHLNIDGANEIFRLHANADAQARKHRMQQATDAPIEEVIQEGTPEEATIASYADSRERLLDMLQGLPPAGFERLCQRLLREAGFQEVTVTGRTGDMGIDGHGVLEVNPFVTFKVLFQCKRYRGSVGAPDVRNFRGAMEGRADKGIIITTGSFTQDARKEARRDGTRAIELVDGEKLVEMFEKLELGLKPRTVFDVDEAFFDAFRE